MSNERLEELLKRPYGRVLVPAEEGGYVGYILELPGCISEGETADETIDRLYQALESHLASMLKSGDPIPEPVEEREHREILERLDRRERETRAG